MQSPELTPEELEELTEKVRKESKEKRARTPKTRRMKSNVPIKRRIDKKKKKKSSRYKICPACQKEITRRTSEGTCIKCDTSIYLADGEYFLIKQPIEKLIVHNWSKFVEEYSMVDVQNEDSVKDLIPNVDEVSPIYLKNEAGSAKKLLDWCDKDFDLALTVIDEYHKTTNNVNTGMLSLRYIISWYGIKSLIHRAKKVRARKRIEDAISSQNLADHKDVVNNFGQLHSETNPKLSEE